MNVIIYFGIALVIALIISSPGFFRVVYFISIGYAYSIALIALTMGILFRSALGITHIIQLSVLTLYGIRLGTYILLREGKSSYKRELIDVHERERAVGSLKRIPIWFGVSVLYTLMMTQSIAPLTAATGLSPFFLSAGHPAAVICTWTGLMIMILGFLLESIADWQKNRFKKKNPSRYCNTGLYRVVRCPNYFGEILVWLGGFIAGMSAFGRWYFWVFALIGLICIILIMMGSTKRLEAKQNERYGNLPDYRAYITETPVLFPFIPVYSLKNIRVFLE